MTEKLTKLLDESIRWNSKVVAEKFNNEFFINGIAVSATVSRNGVRYTEEELRLAAPSLVGRPLLKDHNATIESIAGKVVAAKYDESKDAIVYRAKVVDEKAQSLIENDMIPHVSIGAGVREMTEEKMDDGSEVMTAKGIEFHELSFVPVAGDPNTTVSMAFAVKEAFDRYKTKTNKEEKKMTDVKEDAAMDACMEEHKDNPDAEAICKAKLAKKEENKVVDVKEKDARIAELEAEIAAFKTKEASVTKLNESLNLKLEENNKAVTTLAEEFKKFKENTPAKKTVSKAPLITENSLPDEEGWVVTEDGLYRSTGAHGKLVYDKVD